MRAAYTLAGILSLVVSSAPNTTAKPPQAKAERPPGAIELLSWLPADTETVTVTQHSATQRNGPWFESMAMGFAEINFGNRAAGAAARRHLGGISVNATIEGSRHFRPPTGLGGTRYEGAKLFVLDKPLGSRRGAVMSELEKVAEGVMTVEGFDVVQLRDKFEQDIWTFYITMPQPDVVIVATDRAYLAEVLRRRMKRPESRALPPDLPAWQWVDTTAPFWALRHYRRDRVDRDPTSPFVRDGVASEFDEGAVGVTASVTSDGKTVVVRYLSTSGGADAVAGRMWKHPNDGVDPAIRRVAGNVIEVRFTARDGNHLSAFFFFLFAALGHAIYV